MKNIEIEYKFQVKNINSLLKQLQDGKQPKIYHINDRIFGCKNEKGSKIRERVSIGNRNSVTIEKTTPIISNNVNKKIEEKLKKIPKGWLCENSYNKIRWEYDRDDCQIMIDFYSFGVFCEIEGSEKHIKAMAKKLGFQLKDNIKENIDLVFVKWWKEHNNDEDAPFHWGF